MTLVNAETGELVDLADEAAAADLVARIDAQVSTVNTEAGVLVELCADALRSKAWVSLGYGSWSDLCDSKGWEFRPRTGTDRAALAQVMRENGMSYRAIGKLVGVAEGTVRNDLRGAQLCAPDGIAGTDGKVYPATQPQPEPQRWPEEADDALDAVIDDEPLPPLEDDDEPEVEARAEPRPTPPTAPPRDDRPRDVIEDEQRRYDHSFSFVRAISQLGSLLPPAHETESAQRIVAEWDDSAVKYPAQGAELNPTGLRRIAESLLIVANEWEAHRG